MTAIIGLLCTNGVIIGADSSVTFTQGQMRTIEQPSEKLDIIGDKIIIGGTGQVGFGQRFSEVVQKANNDKLFNRPVIDVTKTLCRWMLDDLGSTFMNPGQYGALVAFPCGGKIHLCEFAIQDFQPELKTDKLWYCSMGSSQSITDPFLALMRDIFWQGACPTVQDGVFAVTWTLEHAISVNPGGVNSPIRIAVLTISEKGSPNARILENEELEEHREHIQYAKNILRKYREDLKGEPGENVRDIPHSS